MGFLSYETCDSCPMNLFSISSLEFFPVESMDANHDQDGNSLLGGPDGKSWIELFGAEIGT